MGYGREEEEKQLPPGQEGEGGGDYNGYGGYGGVGGGLGQAGRGTEEAGLHCGVGGLLLLPHDLL